MTILKRKSITKEVLFQYLHEKNVIVPAPTTKSVLIDKICEYWNLEQPSLYKFQETIQNNSINEPSENCTGDLNLLGQKFTEWFYNMINTSPVIDSEHFWSDSSLILNLISDTQTITEAVSNDCEKTANLLSVTKTSHNLFFNPNLSDEGITTIMNKYGLVLVTVCGTLHTDKECVGIFEQVFGLARDPFSENNWKIKSTQLNLRSKCGVTELPKLGDVDRKDCLSITEC